MNPQKTIIAILATLVASIALADDFKTVNAKEYKNATVSHVEADGITIKFSGGIVKIPFTDLPKDVQERFHYDPEKAAQFSASVQAAAAQSNAMTPQQQTPQQQTQVVAETVHTIREVESDQPRFVDQPVLLKGTIEISNYYNFGYHAAQQSHYAFDIVDNTRSHCHAYMERATANSLRQRLLAAEGPLKGVFTVVLLSRRYERASDLFVELLDYRLEQ